MGRLVAVETGGMAGGMVISRGSSVVLLGGDGGRGTTGDTESICVDFFKNRILNIDYVTILLQLFTPLKVI